MRNLSLGITAVVIHSNVKHNNRLHENSDLLNILQPKLWLNLIASVDDAAFIILTASVGY